MRVLALLDSEPVRTRLYPVVVILIGYLVTRGVLDNDTANLVASIAAAILGVGAVEATRVAVVPKAMMPPKFDKGGWVHPTQPPPTPEA